MSKISADMDLKFPVTISDSLSIRRMFRRMRRISNEIDSSEIWRQSTTALSPDVHVDVNSSVHIDRHIRSFAGSLEPESLSHTLIGHPQ